ncbi:MAG: DUF3524 domain-containing protein [Lentisphaeraceae bacterium]|nr:DUF3524 domain-containing protein [Lentisphaeraceae bacterium]
MKKLKILALNPFHGGSHKAFLDHWIKHSIHNFTLLTLPGTQWRWRLKFAAVEFSEQVKELFNKGERWDIIICTSMMNVAEFRGLSLFLKGTPLVTYFHENQLTYPESKNVKFSLSYSMKNINSALASDHVWFNSAFHRDDFLKAARRILKKKPNSPVKYIDDIEKKSEVHYLGIDEDFYKETKENFSEPVKLVWAARWEEDKNPGLLFMALRHLKEKGVEFQVSVLGEEMGTRMACFLEGEKEFSNEIIHFGFAESKDEYRRILQEADIFISTADHEFFGLSAVEALAAGCIPVVPEHLAYPEILRDYSEYFYKPRSSVQLAGKIEQIIREKNTLDNSAVQKYFWQERVISLDRGLLSRLM